MHLEFNDQLKTIDIKQISKDFPEIKDPARLYIFKYAPGVITDDPHPENKGRKNIPNRPLMNFYNINLNGVPTKLLYYRSKYTKGKDEPTVYAPDCVEFDRTGQIIVDLSEDAPAYAKDISLVYWLLHNPQRGPGHFILVDQAKTSAKNVEAAKEKTKAMAMVSFDGFPGYITDDQLVSKAKLLQIENSEAKSNLELRDQMAAMAENDPANFLKKISSPDAKDAEILQSALDFKVIYYNFDDKSYYYTFRKDTSNPFQKSKVDTAFLKVSPNKYHEPFINLMEFVSLNRETVLQTINSLVVDERAYLNSFPRKGKKTVAELAKQVSVT